MNDLTQQEIDQVSGGVCVVINEEGINIVVCDGPGGDINVMGDGFDPYDNYNP